MLQNLPGTANIRITCLVWILAFFLGACGLLGSKGDEPKGDAFLPLSGVGPYMKEDQDCEADFLQPIFMSSGNENLFWGEPWALPEGGERFLLFFQERDKNQGTLTIMLQQIELQPAPADSCRSRNIRFLSPSGQPIPEPEPGLILEEAGAPSVIREGGRYRMWYGMEGGQGIGYAEFLKGPGGNLILQEDESLAPVLVPSEPWEGTYVGSPSVLLNPAMGYYQMWYEGNIFCGKAPVSREDLCYRSIGYATSADGINWIKRDAAGRNSQNNPGEVSPLLSPTQPTWEFHYPVETQSGTVGMPHVILHRTPVRTLYYLFYTGNLHGFPSLNLDDIDTSIGFAGSEDGVNWVKSSTIQEFGDIAWEVNPVLNEVFPLDVVNKLFAELLGEGYKYMISGSSNVFFPFVIVDEIAPCALDMGTSFFLFFQQTGSLDQSKGLGLAIVERLE